MRKITSRTVNLEDALADEPFFGDETDTTTLSDKIVKAAKDHPRCQICEAPIAKGEMHRALTERLNEGGGGIMTFRFCNKCTRAMAMICNGDDGAKLIESRHHIGHVRREKMRAAAQGGQP